MVTAIQPGQGILIGAPLQLALGGEHGLLLAGVHQTQQDEAAGNGKEQAEQDNRAEQGVGQAGGGRLRPPLMLGHPEQLQSQLQGEQQDGEAQHPVGGGQPLVAPELPQQQANLQREHAGEGDDPAVHIG